jgi:HPt (histidine-containing phosphotransfer) domain-containing protein
VPLHSLLDRGAALAALGGDEELLDELHGMFTSEWPGLRGELIAATAGPALGRVAHAIKGSLAAIGALGARQTAALLETACQGHDGSQQAKLRRQLVSDVDALCAALAGVAPAVQQAPGA